MSYKIYRNLSIIAFCLTMICLFLLTFYFSSKSSYSIGGINSTAEEKFLKLGEEKVFKLRGTTSEGTVKLSDLNLNLPQSVTFYMDTYASSPETMPKIVEFRFKDKTIFLNLKKFYKTKNISGSIYEKKNHDSRD